MCSKVQSLSLSSCQASQGIEHSIEGMVSWSILFRITINLVWMYRRLAFHFLQEENRCHREGCHKLIFFSSSSAENQTGLVQTDWIKWFMAPSMPWTDLFCSGKMFQRPYIHYFCIIWSWRGNVQTWVARKEPVQFLSSLLSISSLSSLCVLFLALRHTWMTSDDL